MTALGRSVFTSEGRSSRFFRDDEVSTVVAPEVYSSLSHVWVSPALSTYVMDVTLISGAIRSRARRMCKEIGYDIVRRSG